MANIKRLYVFVTSFISGIAVLFAVVALATEEWVVSDSVISITDSSSLPSNNVIKYGLFQGTHKMTEPTTLTVQVTMTCLFEKNVCAQLCARSAEGRTDILKGLYNGSTTVDQPFGDCPSVRTRATYRNNLKPTFWRNGEVGTDSTKYINCGVWLSTVIFLCLSILFGALATILSVYNTVSNPVADYLSIFGLYIYNGIACCCAVIAMMLWGVMFTVTIFHNIGIFYTLNNVMDSDKRSSLGYSYWLLVIPVFFYIGSIGVLFLRQYLVSKDPGQKIVQQEDSADPVLYLY